jgi:hypothetical protein
MTLLHAYSQTVADGTATSVVRPSDWNSQHKQFITLSGNTSGQSTISGTNIVYQGGNNVTLSAITAAGAATIVVSGGNTTQFAGTGTTLNLTNLSGTLNVGSNGVALSLNNIDANLMGWELEGANTAGTTGTTMTTNAPLYLSGGNGITLSGNSNTIVINAGGAVATNNYYAAMTTGQTFVGSMGQNSLYLNYMDLPSNVKFCHADQLVSLNPASTTSFNSVFTAIGAQSTITTVVSAATWALTRSFGIYAQGTGTNSTRLELLPGSSTVSLGATIGYTLALSQSAGFNGVSLSYTGTQRASNGFSLGAIASVNTTGGVTYTTIAFQETTSKATSFSNGAGAATSAITVSVGNVSTSLFTGLRDFVAPMVSNLGPGNYWLAQAQSSASTTSGRNTAALSMSQVMNTTLNITNFQHLSETANNATSNFMPYQGVYTVSTAGFPATIGSNQVSNNTAFSNAGVPTIFMYDPFP